MDNLFPKVPVGDLIKSKNDKSKQLNSSEYLKSGALPIIDQGKTLICGYSNNHDKKHEKGLPVIIFGDHTLHVKFIDFPFTIGADGTQVLGAKSDNIDTKYLYYIVEQASSLIGSQGYNRHFKLLKEFGTPYTDLLPEQKKIASILTSVDEVIEKTELQISKLQDLKKGMMQELLTEGLGHTEFKDSPVGRIPKSWDVVAYGDVVKVNMPQIILKDDDEYSPVIVRRRHNGAEVREVKKGKKILVKQQYEAIEGTFLISKRQIFHGSCCILPKFAGYHAIISKEYLALSPKENLDLRFLDYFSHSDLFQNSIIKTTYGIDVEKFVFKDQWWFKELMPLPPLKEQRQICNYLDALNRTLSKKQLKMNKLICLKKALMQDLLTGKVRVKVN